MFDVGETTKSFTVDLINDEDDEGDEIFKVLLSSPGGAAVVGGPSVATVNIVDDESASRLGHWSIPLDLPLVPIHMILLPTGKIMFYEDRGETNEIRLWDPETGIVSTPALPAHDIFCSGHSFLEDGTLLVTGGHILDNYGLDKASVYDPFIDRWTNVDDMIGGRWYPTNTTLPNGDVLVLSGDDTPGMKNSLPQVWQPETNTWRNLTDADDPIPLGDDLYPRMFQTPKDNMVFKAGPDQETWFLDTSAPPNLGEWTPGPRFGGPDFDCDAPRFYGPAVIYDGKVLLIGGGEDPVTRCAQLIDLNEESPAWITVEPMNFKRRHHNGTFLPDGKVLVTGGTSTPGFNDADGAVLEVEIWDPERGDEIPGTGVRPGEWSIMAPIVVKRLYHSTALLLPDGRVLSAGGGQPSAEEEIDHRSMEIYSPPYLFNGSRPTIASAPEAVTWGQPFFVQTADAADITKVSLIRLGAVTHAFDQNQRFVTLAFSPAANGLIVTIPSNPNLAPPGHYMLFIINGQQVPSVADIVQVTQDAGPSCLLDVELSYNGNTLTIDYTLGTNIPATWSSWLLSRFTISPLWSFPVPPIPVQNPLSGSVPVPGFPNIGNIAVLSLLAPGPVGVVTCLDAAVVDTGGIGPTVEELLDLLEESAIGQSPVP